MITLVSFSQENLSIVSNNDKDLTNIQAYPNPFKEKTTINFNSKSNFDVDFIVQDLLGNIIYSEKIKTTDGKNTITFYKNKLSSGIYIYTLKTKNHNTSKRFVIK
jgi:hypothetical protein